MILNTLELVEPETTPFQLYLLTSSTVKKLCKVFDFYNIEFFKKEKCKESIVGFKYPKGNVYWCIDFMNYVFENIEDYNEQWNDFIFKLRSAIIREFNELKDKLNNITPTEIINYQLKYVLRDYQAYDLAQFKIKYTAWNNRGLILSDPRTGKTRVALAACNELCSPGTTIVTVCPKTAIIGWMDEIKKIQDATIPFIGTTVIKISDLKKVDASYDENCLNIRVLSYDIFKKLTASQIVQLTSKSKKVMLLVDEAHRLRHILTQQSEAIFRFKKFISQNCDLGIIGLTGTPAVKESSDVFGLLCLMNTSKIQFNPFYYCLNNFKEYFYYCEDSSFGKKTKALRREDELNYLVQIYSVQTKQKELKLFKNYTKVYKKIDLEMDREQKEIYDSVYENMDYDDVIDCQNKLVQLVRLQQICIDPFGLVPSYGTLSPKIKWILRFVRKNKEIPCIIAAKKLNPLNHISKLFEELGIPYTTLFGTHTYKTRIENINNFKSNNVKVLLLQLDTGRESLTLPEAKVMIFLDRDFAQGYNEQAEARITPVDGHTCTKYIVDLVMKNTKEEEIYSTLVIKKKSIDAMNIVFKARKEG